LFIIIKSSPKIWSNLIRKSLGPIQVYTNRSVGEMNQKDKVCFRCW